MTSLQELLEDAERLWPLSLAEEWDAPGLVTGSPSQEIRRVMFSVDVTSEVVQCAIEAKADLLIAHHPFLMRGVTTISESTAKGATVAAAIRANLAIYAAHTNADSVLGGVSDAIAGALGLQGLTPLAPSTTDSGIGRIGFLADPLTLGEFATSIARTLPHTASGLRVAGDYNQVVEKVAVCGGAGDSLIGAAIAADVDVYVTADLRHHVVQDAREHAALRNGKPAIIDVSHWASEFIWLETAANQMRRIYPDVVFEICDLRTDPWDFAITQ